MSGLGDVVGGLGSVIGGQMQAGAEHEANQKQLERDRLAADVGAQQAQEKGAFTAQQIRQQATMLGARQKVAYANSGVDSTVGTAAQTQANTQAQAELDAMQARNNAARDVWGFEQAKKQAYENWSMRDADITRKGNLTALGGAGQFAGGLFKSMGSVG